MRVKNKEATVKRLLQKLPLLLVILFIATTFTGCFTTTATLESGEKVEKSYTLGELGPAKGIVFYDKGEYSDGWRYLEVAPATTEISLQWGSFNTLVGNTSAEIGEGFNNTEQIVASQEGMEMRTHAATYCAELSINGYDDWFLPSLEELDLMYWQLARQELGELKTLGFGYWSSSEFDENFAWGEGFSSGVKGKIEKSELFLVRAIRSF